ncbi:hypothetical protein DFH11DRAFT_853068 [Phellopilus nigrolimitatus]|nr:hypothetical protein DFH11DRAFT_853068 [Phellopilus nigrolimitatus]
MLFLWIITQQYSPHITLHSVYSLVSLAIFPLKDKQGVRKFKSTVKTLSKLFLECPLLGYINGALALNDLPNESQTDYNGLPSKFRDHFQVEPYVHLATEGDGLSPSTLLVRQTKVIIPRNVRFEELIIWAMDKLGLGRLVTQGDNLGHLEGELWVAFMPQRQQPVGGLSRGAENAEPSTLTSGPSSTTRRISRRVKVTANKMHMFFLSEKNWRISKNTWKYLVDIFASVHSSHLFASLGDRRINLPDSILSTFKSPALEPGNLNQEDYEKAISRSEVMLYVLWIVGHHISHYKVITLVSSITEDAIRSSPSFTNTDKLIQDLWSARSAIKEIARTIKGLPDPSQLGDSDRSSFSSPELDEVLPLHDRVQSRAGSSLVYRVDVKTSPSCLLRPHEKALVPKTRLTKCVMERLRKDFGEDFFTSQETRPTEG